MSEGKAHRVSKTEIASAKWLRLEQLRYADRHGTERPWEMVARTTTSNGIDAVDVCAVVRLPDAPPQLVVISQYRPPVDAECVEFPAGLVDGGEAPDVAALRELLEETGYVGTVTAVSPPLCYEPGMSGSLFHFVRVDIDGTTEANKNPVPKPDEGEDIAVHLLPLPGLRAALDALSAKGMRVDGKLYTFAQALALAAPMA